MTAVSKNQTCETLRDVGITNPVILNIPYNLSNQARATHGTAPDRASDPRNDDNRSLGLFLTIDSSLSSN